MRMNVMFGALIALVMVLVVSVDPASAVVIGTTDLDGLIAADDFNSGGGAGNTVKTTGSGFFSTTANTNGDNLWHDGSSSAPGRLNAFIGASNLATTGLNAQDLLEDNSNGTGITSPALTTTISVAAGQYDVYVAYVSRVSTSPDSGGIAAGLSGGSLTNWDRSNFDDSVTPTGTWRFSIAKLGTTGAGVTSISIDVAERSGVARNLYVGVGYVAVPEPSSLLLLGIASLGLIGVRRRRK